MAITILTVRCIHIAEVLGYRRVVHAIQDYVYRLALHMIYYPDNASDASQEILILVVTRLSSLEIRSGLRTWVYRVAANYLFGTKQIRDRELGTLELQNSVPVFASSDDFGNKVEKLLAGA